MICYGLILDTELRSRYLLKQSNNLLNLGKEIKIWFESNWEGSPSQVSKVTFQLLLRVGKKLEFEHDGKK